MKNHLNLIGLLLLTVLAIDSQASNYDQANWYATVDVQQLRSKIVPLLPNNHSDVQRKIDENLPKEVHQFTLYGHSEVENDLSVIISGDLNQFQLNDYINSLMFLVDPKEDVDVALFDSSSYKNHTVEHYKISKRDQTKSFYSAKISNDMLVISAQEKEIKNWLDNSYINHDLKSSGMVSVSVNIESAMAHMGADLGSNSQPFRSAVFNKITQFSASLFESSDNLIIESALTTADEATAKQLQQVINGLIAMKSLSDLDHENKLLTAVLAGLEISSQGNDLLMSTEFALKLISEVEVD